MSVECHGKSRKKHDADEDPQEGGRVGVRETPRASDMYAAAHTCVCMYEVWAEVLSPKRCAAATEAKDAKDAKDANPKEGKSAKEKSDKN